MDILYKLAERSVMVEREAESILNARSASTV